VTLTFNLGETLGQQVFEAMRRTVAHRGEHGPELVLPEAVVEPEPEAPAEPAAVAEPLEPEAPAAVDDWATTVARLTQPQPDPWAAVVARLTTNASAARSATEAA
jgi:hypothetical protein